MQALQSVGLARKSSGSSGHGGLFDRSDSSVSRGSSRSGKSSGQRGNRRRSDRSKGNGRSWRSALWNLMDRGRRGQQSSDPWNMQLRIPGPKSVPNANSVLDLFENVEYTMWDKKDGVYLVTESPAGYSSSATIDEETQRVAADQDGYPPGSKPVVFVRQQITGRTRRLVYVRKEYAHLDFLPRDESIPSIDEMADALKRARRREERHSRTHPRRRAPVETAVNPKDEPFSDGNRRNGCCICVENKNEVNLKPCDHKLCIKCAEKTSGKGINTRPDGFVCPTCNREVTDWILMSRSRSSKNSKTQQ
ncbi:unnamed protein product [Bemisia tabaci]|uniref:RING-type domain-containing protein n=1 Tax=Bemisia tabaci TaxID=7038 RepID=A0A9P0AK73_BEMTA|nr:unnamed protein product [Bemisia tabaci]